MIPLLRTRLMHVEPIAEMSGVVHEHVDPPRSIGRHLYRAFNVVLFGDIRKRKLGPAARLTYSSYDGSTGISIKIGHKNEGALFRKQLRDRTPDAVRGASN